MHPTDWQQLTAWNDTTRDLPDRRIEELFEQQVEKTPDAVAVRFEGTQLTYRELNAQANQLAHRLRELGVGPDVLVPICIERSLEMLVGILGILKAGGAYVPLDPEHPPERFAFMLKECEPHVVLTQTRLVDRLPVGPWHVLHLDADDFADRPRDKPAHGGIPTDLAYGIYTSGSTGAPKCALIMHRSVVNLLLAETYRLDETDRVLQKTALTFDPSVPELFAPLRVGACLVVARPGGHKDVRYLLDLIRAEQITWITFVPSLLDVFVDEAALADCTSLRRVEVGGEALSPDLAARFFARSQAELHNVYGPTETTVYSTLWVCRRDSKDRTVPIGRPIANTQLYVLDEQKQPVPIGVSGELYIGGAGLAREYLKRPELTAERFIADPFTAGARLYRTGDLARYRADGNVEFLGRTDHQIKLRGLRIELGEIEASLCEHPAIRESVVVMREKRLVAYVVGTHTSTDDLRAHLAARLPEYMVPSDFVWLDAIPLNANNKADRNALPAPASYARTQPLIAPRTPSEELVARIWREVLGLDEVGVCDDFFELGGHSLLAIQVVSRIRNIANVTIGVGAFFDAPTIEDLARAIDAGNRAPGDIIPRASRTEPAPLSSSQAQLWFLHALDPASIAYNIPFALRLRGPLNEAALARSIDELVRRHDALRTTISGTGVPHMHVSPFRPHVLRAERTGGLHEADAVAAAEIRRPFDFERGPLFRTRLLRVAEDDHILVVTLHHIISDGWSCDVLQHELLVAYAAHTAGQSPELPEPALQLADYATWERARPLENAADYWRQHLAGFPVVLELPTDRTRPPVQTVAGARETFVLRASTVAAIAKLCRAEGVTPFMALFAMFSVLLHRYTAQDKLLVGVPVANRDRTETESAVGMLVNTLAFAADLSGDPTFRDVIARARIATLGGFAHQHLPFNKLVETLQPARDLSRGPIVQVMFAYQSAAVQASAEAAGLSVQRMPLHTRTSKFELMLELVPRGTELDGAIEYNTDLFDRATIARFIQHFEILVETLVADPSARVSQVSLLTPGERHQQLVTWNDTAREFPDRRIEALFEQQVEKTPDAIAVSFEGTHLSYRELDARANQVAHRLGALGVDALVPIYVERSLEMLAGILGILKAGGAYVPLDPEYPAERLAFMLKDCQPHVVVTQAALVERLPAGPWRVVRLDADIADQPRDKPAPGCTSDLAYGIYTSGSTGAPKCALVSHRGVSNLMAWMQATYQLDARDRVLQKTPLIFDASVRELFWPLLCGARVVVARPDGHKQVSYLVDVIRAEQITTINFVPSLLEIFVEEPALADCTSLRRVLSGGEALSDNLRARFYARSRAQLYNHYGPTETTVTSAFWPCPRETSDRTIPIGRPIANTQLYVLDAHRQLVPVGVSGELYIGGVGLARGYLDRPELTHERFVSDPFTSGARLYRTGDIVRYRADGTLEYLGRTDHQVKIRGFRIELGEIEACLRTHHAIRDVIVIAREQNLVAYLVGAAEVDDLRSLLRATLPDYMLPSAFVFLDAFPLLVNGKVDRKALPAPEWTASARRVAPQGAMEVLVAEIWREVLGLDQVGVDDDFFELGGHSLLAMQVLSRIRATTKVEISVRAFFDAPTIRDLARAIDAGIQAPADVITKGSTDEPARLSSTQEQLWFLHALDPASTAYNIPFALRLRGALDKDALARSIDDILHRHDVLRATITLGAGDAPHMRVSPHAPQALHTEPVASLHEAEALAAADARRSFDLERGPLIRTRLLRLGAEDHVLVVTMHHIISDGWSSSVFERELLEAYEAFASGRPSPIPALAFQFADHARWERARGERGALANTLTYWTDHLAGAPNVLELPTDRPRPPLQSFAGARQHFVLQASTNEAIAKLCRAEGMTPFMVLFAVFSVLLHRYTAQDKIVVGVPAANRTRPDAERMIGLFINTLAFAADLSGDPTFQELLQRVRAATLGGFTHQDLPFNKLVEALQPARDLSRNPIVQVMFAYQSGAVKASGQASGLTVSRVPLDTGTSKFDLMLELAPDGTQLSGAVEYNTNLFDGATITRFIQHFEVLVEALVGDPAARVSEVSLLTPAERHQLLVAWNDTAHEFPDRRIDELFEHQVEKTPNATAVRFEGAHLTYRELDERANQLAHRLRELGIGPDVLVPICVERSLDVLPGILGILKAGGAFVPLDPDYPSERLAFMLKDCRPHVIVTQARLVDRLPTGPWQILCLDAGELADRPRGTLPRIGTTTDLAYGIYTSGSTGTPKCALVHHRGVANLVSWMQQTYRLDETDRVLLKTPLIFDASIREMLWPLLSGARVVVARPDGHKEARYLLDVIRAEQITTINFVPSLLEIFVEEPALAECVSLRRVLSGGEVLSDELRARFYARCRANLYNHYGPTETTVTSSFWPCSRERRRTTPIGRPIANTRLYVLDAHRQLVPVGVSGELYIGGVGLARGYLDRPELTHERFVSDPFTPGARLYRTGDIVRYRADGTLEYLGRTDHQVKIRGFRIELGEIESCLRAHPAIRDVIVIARDQNLVAYIIATQEVPDLDDLRSLLQTKLPDYMVPAAFVFLNAFPLLVNGKVDRKALPAPEWTASARRVAPQGAMEVLVAEIWCEVLGLDQVGVCDDFFELGGHSLLAMQVLSRIRATAKVEISVRAFFDAPTIRDLARTIDAGIQAPADVIAKGSADEPARLSSTQEQLWFLHALETTTAVYNIPFVLRLRGALDEDALARSIDDILHRHDVLRATITLGAGDAPHMRVSPHAQQALHAEPVASLHEAEALAAADARRGFDLERGPLIRTRLLRLGAEDHVLVVTMHHIISDGWSSSVFERELLEAYEAFASGRPSPIPALAFQFADHARWERARGERGALASALAYWTDHLAGAPGVLELPTDRPRPLVQSFAGARQHFVLQASTNEAIAKLCRAEGVTPFMVLFAVFSVLLHRYTAQDKIVVGVPAANRTRPDTERMIGLFINTLAFAADLSGDPTFQELLQRVRVATLGGFAHQDLPFSRLVEELHPVRDPTRTPIVQVMFAYQSATPRSSNHPDLTVTRMPVATGTSKFELTLELQPSATEMSGSVEYNTDLFDSATIARFIQHFDLLVEQLVADPTARVSHVPLLTSAERELLVQWNDTARPLPEQRIEELFEQQVLRTPEAIAVRFEGTNLTYRELDARSNQLAHRLRALGVGPDVLVPICVERSLEMLVGFLGILKAGGAYVPLDPDYPPERIALIYKDCEPRVIVTQTRLVDRLPVGPLVLRVDAHDFDNQPRDKPARAGAASHLAYGIYTSGSTGTPKCALVSHRSIVNLLLAETYQLDATDRLLQKTALTFDPSVPELFAALRVGACLVIARPDGHKDVRYLLDLIRAEQITWITFVPSLLDIIVNEDAFADCTSLRRVEVGGEALSTDLVARFFARSRAELHNVYGPTETTVYSSLWVCRRDGKDYPVPIGRPIANTQMHVLDAHQQPVPIGVSGELYIGGAGLARGYLKRPDLTAERFVADPFNAGAQLYRTGDVARFRADGAIEFRGRTDHQVKLRGLRIELGEIEACLRTQAAIRDVVVIVREDVPGQKHLVAYIVGESTADALQSVLRATLPEYMVPSSFVFLDALPFMANGKVDRKALPIPVRAAASTFVAPRNATEERIAEIWRVALGLDQVGVTDDFFALGGHSLLAMQVVAKIRRSFDREIPVRMLLLAKTIEEQARLLDGAPDEHSLSRFITRSDNPIARATIAQEQFWYLSQDDPDPTAYFNSSAFVIDGPLDPALLERSYCEVVAYHSIFRTGFREIDGLLHQVVLPELPEPPRMELAQRLDVPPDRYDDEIKRCVGELLMLPCDLARALGFIRARLISVAPERHLLVMVIHHIVSDGAAFNEQMFAGYARLRAGSPHALPDELPLQYIDFAHARARWSETAQGRAHRAYWEERARGAPPLELPSDFPRAPLDARRDALPFGIAPDLNYPPEYMPLPATVRDAVVRGARSQATTPYMIYLGALAWLFHQMSSQDDISIQTTYSNRMEYPVLEQVQGPLAWWTHIRIDASGGPDFRELIRRTSMAVEGARLHGIVDDYFQLVPHTVRRSTFNYLPMSAIPSELGVADLTIARKRQPFPKWKRQWDLHLTLMDFANNTMLVWTGSEKLYRRETVLALLHRYIDILGHAAD